MHKTSLAALVLVAASSAFVAGAAPMKQTQLASASPFEPVSAVTAIRHLEAVTVVSLRGRDDVLQLAEQEAAKARPLVELLRADQYALRQIDRQRPEVTPSWREAPSV